MGAFVGSYDHTPWPARNRVLRGSLPSSPAIAALVVVVGVGLLLYVRRAQALASTGPSSNWFFNLRYVLSVTWEETGGDLGLVSYFVPLSYLLAGVALLRTYESTSPARIVFLGVSVLMGLTFGVLSSGRSVLLPLLIVLVAIPSILRTASLFRTSVILGVLTLGLFAAVGIALGKGGAVGKQLSSRNWATMRESFVTYAVGGIPALWKYLQNRGPADMGVNSLRTPLAVLKAMGFHVPVAPLVQPYVDIPMPFNAYTVYQPYIKDFGLMGSTAILFALGFLHAELYRRATVPEPRALYVFVFAISLFPLVMQVFQDMYLSVLSTWIQYGAWSALFFSVFRESARSTEADVSGPAIAETGAG